MTSNNSVILLSGRPGVGKSTAISKIVALLGDRAAGFYTREIRAGGQRTGFEIVTLDGRVGYLATRNPDIAFARAAPFGRYRVNLEAIDALAVPAIRQAMKRGQVVVIDEIGPMEILSESFCQAVLEILDSAVTVVGTIVQRPHPFADQVKAHPRVILRTVTPANRDRLPEQVYAQILSSSSPTPSG